MPHTDDPSLDSLRARLEARRRAKAMPAAPVEEAPNASPEEIGLFHRLRRRQSQQTQDLMAVQRATESLRRGAPRDVLPVAPPSPFPEHDGEVPSLTTPRTTTPTAADRASQRHGAFLEEAQRVREQEAQVAGPVLAGVAAGLRRTLGPLVAPFNPPLAHALSQRAQVERELAREGYRLPNEPTTGPLGKAFGAGREFNVPLMGKMSAAEAGEAGGALVGSAPAFVAAGGPARALATAVSRRLGLEVAGTAAGRYGAQGGAALFTRGVVRGAVQGPTEFGLGSAGQAGLEAAFAGERPGDVLREALEAGVHGATTPLALLHLPGEAIVRPVRARLALKEMVREGRWKQGQRQGTVVLEPGQAPPVPRFFGGEGDVLAPRPVPRGRQLTEHPVMRKMERLSDEGAFEVGPDVPDNVRQQIARTERAYHEAEARGWDAPAMEELARQVGKLERAWGPRGAGRAELPQAAGGGLEAALARLRRQEEQAQRPPEPVETTGRVLQSGPFVGGSGGRRGAGERPPLRAAFKYSNKIYPGRPGEIHAQLLGRLSPADRRYARMGQSGFIDPSGRFITRLEAEQVSGLSPEAASEYSSVAPGLHASDIPVGPARRSRAGAGENLPELAAGVAGGAYGYSQGETDDEKLLGALAGATIGSAGVASLRGGRRGARSGPLIGGPEAEARARKEGKVPPLYSRLNEAIEALPESGASLTRLANLQRDGKIPKAEFEHVFGPMLEGLREQAKAMGETLNPEKNIPKRVLQEIFQREGLRLRDVELPTQPDPAAQARYVEANRLANEASNRLTTFRTQTEALVEKVPAGRAREALASRVRGAVTRPNELTTILNDYASFAVPETTVKWRTEQGPAGGGYEGTPETIVTIKTAGKRARTYRKRDSAANIIFAQGGSALYYHLRDTNPGVSMYTNAGEITGGTPPIPAEARAAIDAEITRLDAEYLEARNRYVAANQVAQRLQHESRVQPPRHETYGQDEGTFGQVSRDSYREWLVSIDRQHTIELPKGWEVRDALGDDPAANYEVVAKGQRLAVGETRGEAVSRAYDAKGVVNPLKKLSVQHHWGPEKDFLFHVRADMRTAYDPVSGQQQPVLFIREVQSDYFQAAGARGHGMVDQRTGKVESYPAGGQNTEAPLIAPYYPSNAEGLQAMSDLRTNVGEGARVVMPEPPTGGHQDYYLWELTAEEQPELDPQTGQPRLDKKGKVIQKPTGNLVWTKGLLVAPNPTGLFGQIALRSPTHRTASQVSSGQHWLEPYADDPHADGVPSSDAEIRRRADNWVRDNGVNAAPWRGREEWVALAVRTIVRRAVESGAKRIAWTPGALNSWAKDYGFEAFYDKALRDAFKKVSKELGVELTYEPAMMTRRNTKQLRAVVDNLIEGTLEPGEAPSAADPEAAPGLTPQRVVQAWEQLSQVKPWVLKGSQVLRQVISALDGLFIQYGERYRPIRPPEGPARTPPPVPEGHVSLVRLRELVEHASLTTGEGGLGFNVTGPKVLNVLDELARGGSTSLPRSEVVSILREKINTYVEDFKLKEMTQERTVPGGGRPLPERRMGAQQHGESNVVPDLPEALRAIFDQRPMSDQAKITLLHLLGAEEVSTFKFGPTYWSKPPGGGEGPLQRGAPGVHIPEEAAEKVRTRGFRMLGGIPFDPTWLRAIGLTPSLAAAGAGVGAAADEENPWRGAAIGAAAGGALGFFGGKALKRRGSERLKIEARSDVPAFTPTEAKPGELPAPPQGPLEAPRLDINEYINLAKFDADPSGKLRLADEAERVVRTQGLHPKQVVTWAETREIASQLGLDVTNETLGQVNRRLTGPEMLAIRNIISANIAAAERLYQQRAKLPERSEPTAEIDRLINGIAKQNAHLLDRFIRARSQTGRDLNNLKIVANRTLDPAVWLATAQRVARRDLTASEITTVSQLVNTRDRAQLVQYVAGLRRATPWEKAVTLWKAGLLTNPKTSVVNVTGNTTMSALEMVKDPVAALTDRLLSMASGVRTKGGWSRGMMTAGAKGAAEGLVEARATLRGVPTARSLAKMDLPRETNYDNVLLDTYTKGVFRFIGAQDRPFLWAAYRRSLHEQATLAGRQQGLRGDKLAEYVEGVQKGEGVLADEMMVQAMADAEIATFRNETMLGKFASRIGAPEVDVKVRGYNRRIYNPFVFALPFTRTPAAVATSVLKYSPAGLAKAGVWDLPRFLTAAAQGKDNINGVPLKVLQRELSESVGRGTVGSAAIYLGWLLAGDDRATGAAPTLGTQERQQWIQENRQPNAVRIGDTWHNTGRISPVGNLIALGANLRRIWDPQFGPKTPTERLSELTFSAARTVSDQPFLTGVSGAMAALQEPEREGQRFAQGLIASTVPAIVGATARGLDPTARMREGTLGPIQERIPGLREQLPAQISPLGTPVVRGPTGQPEGLLNALFNPATASADLRASDPLIRELAEIGYGVPRLKRQPDESADAYSARALRDGQELRAYLTEVVADPEFRALSPEERVDQLAREVARVRRYQRTAPE